MAQLNMGGEDSGKTHLYVNPSGPTDILGLGAEVMVLTLLPASAYDVGQKSNSTVAAWIVHSELHAKGVVRVGAAVFSSRKKLSHASCAL